MKQGEGGKEGGGERKKKKEEDDKKVVQFFYWYPLEEFQDFSHGSVEDVMHVTSLKSVVYNLGEDVAIVQLAVAIVTKQINLTERDAYVF